MTEEKKAEIPEVETNWEEDKKEEIIVKGEPGIEAKIEVEERNEAGEITKSNLKEISIVDSIEPIVTAPPEITRTDIYMLAGMHERNAEMTNEIETLLKNAKRNYGRKMIPVERKDGKTMQVPQMALWEELHYLDYAKDCPAYQVLSGAYPKIFDLRDAQEKLAAEIIQFEMRSIGFAGNGMTLMNLIQLVEGIVLMNIREPLDDDQPVSA